MFLFMYAFFEHKGMCVHTKLKQSLKRDAVKTAACEVKLGMNHVAQSVQGNWNSGEGAAVEKKANSQQKQRKWACTPASIQQTIIITNYYFPTTTSSPIYLWRYNIIIIWSEYKLPVQHVYVDE